MQQTSKYQFNLIESSDLFGPEALNENAEATERELLAVRAEFADADAGLQAAVQSAQSAADRAQAAADTLPYVIGSYNGDRTKDIVITLGFRPRFIVVTRQTASTASATPAYKIAAGDGNYLKELIEFTDTGFIVKATTQTLYPMINEGGYIAFR